MLHGLWTEEILAKSLQIAQDHLAPGCKKGRLPMRSFRRTFIRSVETPLTRGKPEETAAPASRAWASSLGPLETRLLELLWSRKCALTVRRIRLAVPDLAYTTLMTTVDRLYRKGLLLRHKDGRAFVYEPRWGREQLLTERFSGHLSELLNGSAQRTMVLSTLVRAVGQKDTALLDELDALVQAERLRLRVQDK
jgi:predicted transcriptional regulator